MTAALHHDDREQRLLAVRAALECAFRDHLKCDGSVEKLGALRSAVHDLEMLWMPSLFLGSPQSQTAGLKKAATELNTIAKSIETSIGRFEKSSKTAIDALGGLDIKMAATNWLRELADYVRDSARDTKNFSAARKQQRPRDMYAIRAATIIIDAFQKISESNVVLPASGKNKKPRGLEPLAERIFNLLDIKANAKAMIRAVGELKECGIAAKQQNKVVPQPAEEFFKEQRKLAELLNQSPRHWKNFNPRRLND